MSGKESVTRATQNARRRAQTFGAPNESGTARERRSRGNQHIARADGGPWSAEPIPGGGWRIVLPLASVPSANVTTREHWTARRRRVDELSETLGWMRRVYERRTAPGRARVRLVLHFRDRRTRDPQNYLGGFKSCCDALVRSGWLTADDAEHLTCDEPALLVDRHAPRAEVEIVPWE